MFKDLKDNEGTVEDSQKGNRKQIKIKNRNCRTANINI